MALITKTEIKSLVYGANFDTALIKDHILDFVELKHVKTMFLNSAGLYDAIVANASNEYDTLLSDYLKPYMAYMVKAEIGEEINLKSGNKGNLRATGSSEQQGGVSGEEKAKRLALQKANGYRALIVEYFQDNKATFTLWKGYKEYDGIFNGLIIL